MKSLLFASSLTAALLGLGVRNASAAEPPTGDRAEDDEPLRDAAFRYTTPTSPNYLRAALEVAGVFGVGYLQYSLNTANSADWDLAFDWPSMRSKLLFRSVTFDTNPFDTNWLTHPGAGYLYYQAARGNRLGIVPSFGYTVIASTLWEYVGEWREQVAINDLITTPMSGLVLGETTTQMGALFHRSRPSVVTTALGWLFAPFASAHDAIDDLEPDRTGGFDDLGFPLDTFHRFDTAVRVGVTKQEEGSTYSDARFETGWRIVALPHYRTEGSTGEWFDSGNVSSLALRFGESGGDVVDIALETHVLLAGWYEQQVATDARGDLVGSSTLAGFHVATEYGIHDYDRDRRRPEDRIALVGAGATFEDGLYFAGLALRARLDAIANFAGVTAYALSDFSKAHDRGGLPTVLREEGYYHAVGATLTPSLELSRGRFDAGASARIDWFESIDVLDRDETREGAPRTAADRRIAMAASLGVSPGDHLRLSLSFERRDRSGIVGDVSSARTEVGVYGGAGLRF